MASLILILELYMAAMLGVSGLAKIDQPAHFAATLQQYRLFPHWSIRSLVWIVPLTELGVAVALVTGLASVATAIAATALFASFLVVRAVLIVTKRVADCGCHGSTVREKLDGASLVVSTVLLLLAAVHLYAVWSGVSVATSWRWPCIGVYASAGGWLLARLRRRHQVQRPALGSIPVSVELPQ